MDGFLSASDVDAHLESCKKFSILADSLEKFINGLKQAEGAFNGERCKTGELQDQEDQEDMSEVCRQLIAKAEEVKKQVECVREVSPEQTTKRQRVETPVTDSKARWFPTYLWGLRSRPLFCLMNMSNGSLQCFDADPTNHVTWKHPTREPFIEEGITYVANISAMLWSGARLLSSYNIPSAKEIRFMRLYLAEPNTQPVTEEDAQKLRDHPCDEQSRTAAARYNQQAKELEEQQAKELEKQASSADSALRPSTKMTISQIQRDVDTIGANFYGPDGNLHSSMLLPRASKQLLIAVLHTQQFRTGKWDLSETNAIGVMPVDWNGMTKHEQQVQAEKLFDSCPWVPSWLC